MNRKTKRVPGVSAALAEQRARDVAAFDAMCATRPKKGPPLRLVRPTVTAGELELRRAKRLGAAA